MKKIVNNFRSYAHILLAVLANLRFNNSVNEMLTLYGIEESKNTIHVTLSELLIIYDDATIQLRQVIYNLLENA